MRATRRKVLIGLGAGALTVPFASFAQPRGKVWRIGFLRTSRFSATDSFQRDAFVEAMRKLGYVEGKNLVIEWRFADGDIKRFPGFAAELAQVNVDAIDSAGTPATIAASKSAANLPIVLLNVADPVASGVAKSLARPGGNVTGVADLTGDLGPKNLEYLVSSVPGVSRVAVPVDPAAPGSVIISNAIQIAAPQARVTVVPVPASTRQEFEDAFPRMKQQKIGACIVAGGNLFSQHIRRIVELAIEHRIPTASTNTPHAHAGVLMTYGPDYSTIYGRAAYYIDRIFKGAKPADLPIEQPTRLELVINLKTVKALGITIPQSILMQAQKVIE